MLILGKNDLDKLALSTEQVVDALETLIRGKRQGTVWAAPKSAMTPPGGQLFMATLSVSHQPALMAVKSLVLNPRNPDKGLAAINSSITLLDSETGIPKALIDGGWVTAVRTACASVVAAKRMARSESTVIAFIGCGVQAHSHLTAYQAIFPLSEIRAFGRGVTNRTALCQVAQNRGLQAMDCASAEQAVREADLVVSSIPLTANVPPFIDVNWLKPGVFVSSTDMGLPFMPDTLPAFDRIIIDDVEQESSMPNPMVPSALVHGELSHLVMDEVVGRKAKDEKTAFIFRAVVLGDLALSSLAYTVAEERGIGARITL